MYRPTSSLNGSSVGVFVGCIWTEFGELLSAHHPARAQAVTGNGLAFMAGRLSYTFGFTGGVARCRDYADVCLKEETIRVSSC